MTIIEKGIFDETHVASPIGGIRSWICHRLKESTQLGGL